MGGLQLTSGLEHWSGIADSLCCLPAGLSHPGLVYMSHCTAGQAQAAGRNLLHNVRVLVAQTSVLNKPTGMRAPPGCELCPPGLSEEGADLSRG